MIPNKSTARSIVPLNGVLVIFPIRHGSHVSGDPKSNDSRSPSLWSFSMRFIPICKARYAVLFQIRTLPPEPEDEAHICPTATYHDVIYPGFQHDMTALVAQD